MSFSLSLCYYGRAQTNKVIHREKMMSVGSDGTSKMITLRYILYYLGSI